MKILSYLIFVLLVEVAVVLAVLPDVCPKIIKKSEWGGRDSAKVQHIIIPLQYVIIHHTATPECLDQNSCSNAIVNMQTYHMDTLDFDDIGYNFIVGGDGNVYEGAGWHRQGAHTYGYNTKSLGIGFIGDFRKKTPPAAQLEAGKKLVDCAVGLKEISEDFKLLGARSVRATESPGMALFNKIRSWRGFTEKP